MSAEVQKSELLSDDSTQLKTFGDYTAKYRTLHQQIVAAEYQLQSLKNNDNRYRIGCFDKLIQQLYKTIFIRKLEIGAVTLVIGYVLAWMIDPEDQKIVSAAIYGEQTLVEIAREHSVSERCICHLIQEYSQIQVPKNLTDEYWEKNNGKRIKRRGGLRRQICPPKIKRPCGGKLQGLFCQAYSSSGQ